MKKISIKNGVNYIKSHKILSIIIILAIIFIFLKVSGGDKNQVTEEYTVTNRTITEQVRIAGTIDSVSRADLGFSASGRVSNIYVKEGDVVAKGQKIASLDTSELYANLRDAEADLNIARANVQATGVDLVSAKQNLEDTISQQETLVENAYQALLTNDLQAYAIDSDNDNTPPTVTGSYNSTEQGEYLIDVYQSSGDLGISYRLRGLEVGSYSATVSSSKMGDRGLYLSFDGDENYDSDDFIIPIPNNRSNTYQQVKSAYEDALKTKQLTIASAQKEFDRLTATESTSNQVSKSAAQINSAIAKVEAVSAKIAESQITAPFSGTIAKIDLEIGETVSSGDSIVTLVTDEDYEMIVQVPEIDVARIRAGNNVKIILDAIDNVNWEGVVKYIDIIDTKVDGVSVYETTVEILNPDERIRVGMNSRADITTATKENVLAIPQYFITTNDEGKFVMKKNGETISAVKIETGLLGSDGNIEITAGLSEGDIITRTFSTEE